MTRGIFAETLKKGREPPRGNVSAPGAAGKAMLKECASERVVVGLKRHPNRGICPGRKGEPVLGPMKASRRPKNKDLMGTPGVVKKSTDSNRRGR